MAVDQEPLFSPRLVPEEDPAAVISVAAGGGRPMWPNASFLSFSSDWSSPAESEQASTSSSSDDEDDDDDYITELTHRMAQYMLQDEEKHENTWGLSGSPQSTLWSPLGSDQESSTGPSREPSPTIESFDEQIGSSKSNPSFQSKQALIDYQIRANKYYRLKQEQAMKEKKVNSDQKAASNIFYQKQRNHQQQACGSDMRAVFLNTSDSNSKNNSCGTGVFLPRSSTTTTCQEPRIKQGCSTVLIPARVVQALKLHFEKTGVQSRLDSSFPLQQDASGSGRHQHNNPTFSQQKHRLKTAPATKRQEISLPQEWTY